MPSDLFQYVLLAGLAIALIIAAFTDLRRRQIDNWLNGAIALAAPLYWWASGMALWPDVAIQLGVGIAAFVVFAALFAMRMMGGGDVKLLTALALWVDPTNFLRLLIIMAIVGGVLTLVMGIWHVMRKRKEKLAIPYGVAIATAGLWIIGSQYTPVLSHVTNAAG